jgi:hypothetical protein
MVNCSFIDEPGCKRDRQKGGHGARLPGDQAGWKRGEIMRSLKRLIAADNMTQKEKPKSRRNSIAHAMMRAGRPLGKEGASTRYAMIAGCP